jgi:hypothetical protein
MAADVGVPAGPSRWRPDAWALLALPGLLFLLVFFGYPLLELLLVSVREPGPENYLVLADSPCTGACCSRRSARRCS